MVTECRVEGGDGRLVATASATFAVTRAAADKGSPKGTNAD